MLELNFSPFPVLKTKRLTLRRVSQTDVNEIFFLRSDADVLKYIKRPPAKTPDDVLKFIELILGLEAANDGITWAITLNGDDKLIGTICFWNIQRDNHRAEIGYVLHPAHQHKGIMNEALNAMLNYGFNTLKFHSFEARVAPEHSASINLLEKNNFVREAYFKEDFFFDGQFLDTAVYSLLTSKFNPKL